MAAILVEVTERGHTSKKAQGGFSNDDMGMAAMLESFTFAHRHQPTLLTVELLRISSCGDLEASFERTFTGF